MCNFQPTIIALSEVTCNVQLEVRYSCFGFVHDDGEDWSSIPSLQGDVCWHWYWNTGYRAVYWFIFPHLYYNDEVLLARIEQFLRSLRDTFELGRDTWISLLLSILSLGWSNLSPHSWSSLAIGVSLETPTTSETLVICQILKNEFLKLVVFVLFYLPHLVRAQSPSSSSRMVPL